MEYIKSPIFYMGNKYELLGNLFLYFPRKEEVNLFIDLFGGSGVVAVNSNYKNVVYNELNENIFELFKLFINKSEEEIINHILKRIEEFYLITEEMDERSPKYTKEKYEIAKERYLSFREFYNKSEKNYLDLFTLSHFSFCNLIRFNSQEGFNMPFGNRCFLEDKHTYNISNFIKKIKSKELEAINENAIDYLKRIRSNVGQFIYLDPPYTNTLAIYNEQRAHGGWNIESDLELFKELDRLNDLGIKWAMSNVLINKGKENTHIKEWAIKNNYEIIEFEEKQYSALGKGNAQSLEVLIVNYETPHKRYDIFDFI